MGYNVTKTKVNLVPTYSKIFEILKVSTLVVKLKSLEFFMTSNNIIYILILFHFRFIVLEIPCIPEIKIHHRFEHIVGLLFRVILISKILHPKFYGLFFAALRSTTYNVLL